MKKIFNLMLAALVLASVTGCKKVEKPVVDEVQQQEEPQKTEKSEHLAYETIIVEEGNDSLRINFRFVIDYPTMGNESLVREIKQNIFHSLGDSTSTDFGTDNLSKIGLKFLDESKKDSEEFRNEMEDGFIPAYSFDGSIKMVDNTNRFVTYKVNSYTYSGGAHGMPYTGYFTIDKRTNKTLKLNDIIDAKFNNELAEIIKKSIVAVYYEGNTPNWDDVFKFALPTQAPGMTTDGIIFCYGAYEIDCYAAGMPYCTIKYEDIEHLMTPEAKALIK